VIVIHRETPILWIRLLTVTDGTHAILLSQHFFILAQRDVELALET